MPAKNVSSAANKIGVRPERTGAFCPDIPAGGDIIEVDGLDIVCPEGSEGLAPREVGFCECPYALVVHLAVFSAPGSEVRDVDVCVLSWYESGTGA